MSSSCAFNGCSQQLLPPSITTQKVICNVMVRPTKQLWSELDWNLAKWLCPTMKGLHLLLLLAIIINMLKIRHLRHPVTGRHPVTSCHSFSVYFRRGLYQQSESVWICAPMKSRPGRLLINLKGSTVWRGVMWFAVLLPRQVIGSRSVTVGLQQPKSLINAAGCPIKHDLERLHFNCDVGSGVKAALMWIRRCEVKRDKGPFMSRADAEAAPLLSPPVPSHPFAPAGVNLRLGGLSSWVKWMTTPGRHHPHFSPVANARWLHMTPQDDHDHSGSVVLCFTLCSPLPFFFFFFLCYSFSLSVIPLPVIATFLQKPLYCRITRSWKVWPLSIGGWRHRSKCTMQMEASWKNLKSLHVCKHVR